MKRKLIALLLISSWIRSVGAQEIPISVKLENHTGHELLIAVPRKGVPSTGWLAASGQKNIVIDNVRRETEVTLKNLEGHDRDDFAQRFIVPEGAVEIFFHMSDDNSKIEVMLCDQHNIICRQYLSMDKLTGKEEPKTFLLDDSESTTAKEPELQEPVSRDPKPEISEEESVDTQDMRSDIAVDQDLEPKDLLSPREELVEKAVAEESVANEFVPEESVPEESVPNEFVPEEFVRDEQKKESNVRSESSDSEKGNTYLSQVSGKTYALVAATAALFSSLKYYGRDKVIRFWYKISGLIKPKKEYNKLK